MPPPTAHPDRTPARPIEAGLTSRYRLFYIAALVLLAASHTLISVLQPEPVAPRACSECGLNLLRHGSDPSLQAALLRGLNQRAEAGLFDIDDLQFFDELLSAGPLDTTSRVYAQSTARLALEHPTLTPDAVSQLAQLRAQLEFADAP